jgi:hypothetical protein
MNIIGFDHIVLCVADVSRKRPGGDLKLGLTALAVLAEHPRAPAVDVGVVPPSWS